MKKTHQQLERNSRAALIKQFVIERDRALLSLDEATIRAHNLKWGVREPADPATFWAGIHKARTACVSLPLEARLLSKMWLTARGYQSFDDGDLNLEVA